MPLTEKTKQAFYGTLFWGKKFTTEAINELEACNDTMPPSACKQLGVPEGSTFSTGMKAIRDAGMKRLFADYLAECSAAAGA